MIIFLVGASQLAEQVLAERIQAERLASLTAADPLLRLQQQGGAGPPPPPSSTGPQHTHTHAHTHLHLHQPEAASLLSGPLSTAPHLPPGQKILPLLGF